MNNRINLIALRIAQLKEEFSENDILQAIRLLEDQGTPSQLLKYLTGNSITNKTKKENSTHRKSKKIDEQRSKAIIELERTDIEKYQILSPFDAAIRTGSIFPTMDDLKTFGTQISKDFIPKKSRRDTISAVMQLLAKRPLEDVKIIVKSHTESSKSDRSNEYQELAQFIINGKSTHGNL